MVSSYFAVVLLAAAFINEAGSFLAHKCEEPFSQNGQSCYYIEYFKVRSATRAEEYCAGLRGYLTNINSSGEQHYIEQAIMAINATQSKELNGYWIGGYYNNNTSEWDWKRGSNESPIVGGYHKWSSIFEPDHENQIPPERNLAVMKDHKVPWSWSSENGNSKTLKMGFVCERDL